jgi:hypothetical protein
MGRSKFGEPAIMFDKKFDKIFIGNSYISILKAIGEIRKGNKVLIIDDERFSLGDHWFLNIGDLERRLLSFYCKSFGLDNSMDFENYLTKTNTMLYLNDRMIELSSSPFANIKEFARKIPECFSSEFINSLSSIDSEQFNTEIDGYFNRIIDLSLIKSNTDLQSFFIPENQNIEKVLSTFLSYLDSDSLKNKQLQYILQVMFQTFFSNKISEVESRYLLCSILGSRYQVDKQALMDQLLFEYKSLGGKVLKSKINNWEIYENKLHYILLDSYEGILNAKEFYLYGHLGAELPFDYPIEQVLYKSLKLNSQFEHDFSSLFKNKRIVFSESDKIGTDFPHFEVFLKENNDLEVLFSYADYEGTKPKFYYEKAASDVFKSLNNIFPGLNEKDWMSQIQATAAQNIWLENINNKLNEKRASLYTDIGTYCEYKGKRVDSLIYEGPLRGRFIGLFGYILNVLG